MADSKVNGTFNGAPTMCGMDAEREDRRETGCGQANRPRVTGRRSVELSVIGNRTFRHFLNFAGMGLRGGAGERGGSGAEKMFGHR